MRRTRPAATRHWDRIPLLHIANARILKQAGRCLQTLWYPESAERSRVLGVAPLDDQQLAGLLMWIPSGIVFSLFGLALFSAWLGDAERRASVRERSAAKTSSPTASALP